MADATKVKLKLKLLVDKKAQKVVFAEAGKDFVDFLFNLLRLPIGAAVLLLPKDSMIGSFPNLYRSFETLDQTFLQPNLDKQFLLRPAASPAAASAAVPRLLAASIYSPAEKTFYKCGNYNCSSDNVTDDSQAKCPRCDRAMSDRLNYIAPLKQEAAPAANGYVKEMVTYMVMDDLTVRPSTMISTIAVLNAANVKEFEALDAKDVEFGAEEGLKLLEACICSKAVLSYLFLGKKVVNNEAGNGEDAECAVATSWVNEMAK